ncbi:M20 family metallopeptidase [Polaromonas sp. UC242_47]|uniref:M20 family metallopeptidase n=1 Tax=Polaromonas sp. UC242_47 TaxID=3374626 RepID=UPI00378D19CB
MKEFETWFQGQFDQYVKDLETLVNIDSGSRDQEGVRQVLAWLETFFKQRNIPCERHHHGETWVALSASVGEAAAREKNILLLGHCDTVFPAGEAARRPFKVKDGIGYGPGVTDMKAGVLMNAYLLHAWQLMGRQDMALSCLFTSDEEIASPRSAEAVAAFSTRSAYVFNSEPGRPNGNVVIGRRGGVFFGLEIQGRAAHAGNNFYEGISAISSLADKIRQIDQLTSREDDVTVSVGLIRGGVSVNTVAPHASAEIDLRVPDMAQRDRYYTLIGDICRDNPRGETSSLTIKGEFQSFVQSDASKRLAEMYLSTSVKHGLMVQGQFTGGCSDAGIASTCGAAVICAVGPSGGGYHTEDEYVDLGSVVPKASILFNTMKQLG